MDLNAWILTGLIPVGGTILGYMLKFQFKQIVGRLDDVIRELKTVSAANIKHDEQIKYLHDGHSNMSHRLNDHSLRIRTLESQKS